MRGGGTNAAAPHLDDGNKGAVNTHQLTAHKAQGAPFPTASHRGVGTPSYSQVTRGLGEITHTRSQPRAQPKMHHVPFYSLKRQIPLPPSPPPRPPPSHPITTIHSPNVFGVHTLFRARASARR